MHTHIEEIQASTCTCTGLNHTTFCVLASITATSMQSQLFTWAYYYPNQQSTTTFL